MHDEQANAAREKIHEEDAYGELVGVSCFQSKCRKGRAHVQQEQYSAHHAPEPKGHAVFEAACHETRRYHCQERRHAAPRRGTKKQPHDFDDNVRYGDVSGVQDLNRILWCYLWGANQNIFFVEAGQREESHVAFLFCLVFSF